MTEREPQEMNPWRLTFELAGIIAGGLLITQTWGHFGDDFNRLSEVKQIVATLENPHHSAADIAAIKARLSPTVDQKEQDLLDMARQHQTEAQAIMNDDGFTLDSGLILDSIAGISLYMHASRNPR